MIELAATIGGTVADIKRLPQSEVHLWQQYAVKHGGLPLQRITTLLAQLCHMFNNANGGKAELRDYLPGLPAREISDDASFEAFNRLLDETYGY